MSAWLFHHCADYPQLYGPESYEDGHGETQQRYYYDAPTPPRARPREDLSATAHYASWRRQPSYEQPALARPPAPTGRVQCDRCDGPHETERCPHFKKPRDSHPDALANYSGATASRAAPTRECVAPRQLSRRGASVQRMPGDGACLFHSLAYGLRPLGFQEDGHSVRQRIAQFIAQQPDTQISGTPLRSWVDWDSHETVGSYARRLQSGSLWGGAIEMAACARIFAVDVAVYEEDSWSGDFHRISDFLADGKPWGAVYIRYSGRSHYDAIVVHGGGAVQPAPLARQYSGGHDPRGHYGHHGMDGGRYPPASYDTRRHTGEYAGIDDSDENYCSLM